MAQDADIPSSVSSLISPPSGQIAIAPGDTLNKPIRGFILDSAANVAVLFVDNTVGFYGSCSAGTIYPGLIQKILTSGTDSKGNTVTTTATLVRRLY